MFTICNVTSRGPERIGSTVIRTNPTYDDTLQLDCCAAGQASAEERRERPLSEISAKILRPEFVRWCVIEWLLFALLAAVSSWPILRAIEALRFV